MTVHAVPGRRRKPARALLTLPVLGMVLLAAAVTSFVAYLLWPTWPSRPVSLDAPALPITVADVLFNIPPAAIRAAVQRHPGRQERIDLAFVWPSLTPPRADDKNADKPALDAANAVAAATASEDKRLFVTIAPLGPVLPPLERLRTIYPRYAESEAAAGPDGLAILPFRAGTPYAGEDLVYLGDKPEQFFALCTRPGRAVPGTCMQERLIEGAEITLRFPRDWLPDWRNVAAGFDRLLAQLHPPGSQGH